MNKNDGLSIEIYLRQKVHDSIIKFLEKSKCEYCGSTNNLEFHHKKDFDFSTILHNSLYALNIKYESNYKNYSSYDLKNLEYMVLGYHLMLEFSILCENCHKEYHSKNTYKLYKCIQKYKWQMDFYKNIFPESTMEDFINNFNKIYIKKLMEETVNNRNILIDKNEIESFKHKFKDKLIRETFVKTGMLRARDLSNATSIKGINKILLAYNILYIIKSKTYESGNLRDKTYWVIEENENGR